MGLLFGFAGAHTYLKSGQVAPSPRHEYAFPRSRLVQYMHKLFLSFNSTLFILIEVSDWIFTNDKFL